MKITINNKYSPWFSPYKLFPVLFVFILFLTQIFLPGTSPAHAQTGKDYLPPEVLDKPLGITPLPNGNILITDAGGANYTTTDAAVLEVNPLGEVVWIYAQPMAFPHSAQLLSDGTILITDTGNDRIFRIDRAGSIVWTSEDWNGGTGTLSDGSHLDYPNDAELLENGNILLTDRNNDRALEITTNGEVVWMYDRLVRPHNPDRLENGNTMISDSESNLVIEVDPQGQIVWQYGGTDFLNWPRDADRLENGNTLVTDSRNNRVIEVTSDDQVVWEYGGLSIPYEADRLENGNTLISDNNHKRVIEVDPQGEIVRTFRNYPDDYPAELENGGFEIDNDGDGLPDNWYPADLNAEGPATFFWDANEKRSGSRSAGLEYFGPGRAAWLQTVRVEPGQVYEFSGDIQAQIVDGVAAYQIWFLDDLGGPIGEPTTVEAVTASTDWIRTEAEVSAPEGATAVQIWALSLAEGRVWFDNISLEPSGVGNLGPIGIIVGAILLVILLVVIVVIFRHRIQSGPVN